MRPLPVWLRATLYTTFGALWITGGVIFALKHYFQVATEFGSAPHPWQPDLLAIHGLVAVAALYFFGWVSAQHVGDAWRSGTRRASGWWLIAVVSLLTLTGFGAYHLVEDSVRSVNGTIHELVGLAFIVPGLVHLLVGRRKRRV
jgi:hypothetical protein